MPFQWSCMKRGILVLVVTIALTNPARAQSRVFIGGDVFADLKRFSGDPSMPTVDGNAVGGGASVGVLIGGRWSVSLDAEWSTSTTKTSNVLYPIPLVTPAIPAFPMPTTSNRLMTTTALLGYHARMGDRVSLGM